MKPNKVALGVLGGIAVGAVLGVLFAPAKETKTRRKIFKKGNDYAGNLKGKYDELFQNVSDKYDDAVKQKNKIKN